MLERIELSYAILSKFGSMGCLEGASRTKFPPQMFFFSTYTLKLNLIIFLDSFPLVSLDSLFLFYVFKWFIN